MNQRIFGSVLGVLVVLGLSVRADTIVVRGRDKPLEGNVKSEDAKNIVVSVTVGKKKGDETIPSVDVVDIVYESISPSTLGLKGGPYRIAKDAEKDADSDDAAKRKAALATAIASYTETLAKMAKDTQGQKFAARHLQYKVAILMLRQATDLTATDRAVLKLQAFKTSFPSSWQVNKVMPLIAQVQMDAKDWKEAEKTFEEMAGMEAFSPETRRDAELMIVTVAVRKGDIALANKRLDALASKAGKDIVFLSRVNMARAEVLVGLKQFDKAILLLHDVIKESKDKQTKALAHNTLGECLYKADRFSEAVWEFLWVDAVYNQDRNQHAKALYFLWKTFEKMNNAERAQECRETLLERPFVGTEYQRLAHAQTKTN